MAWYPNTEATIKSVFGGKHSVATTTATVTFYANEDHGPIVTTALATTRLPPERKRRIEIVPSSYGNRHARRKRAAELRRRK